MESHYTTGENMPLETHPPPDAPPFARAVPHVPPPILGGAEKFRSNPPTRGAHRAARWCLNHHIYLATFAS